MLLIFREKNHVNLGCVQRPQGSQESKIALKIFLFHTYCDFHCEVLSQCLRLNERCIFAVVRIQPLN